jgi:hypothetical protein
MNCSAKSRQVFAAKSNVVTRLIRAHEIRFTLPPKSRLARYRVNRLPLFCRKLYFPCRHIFLEVRER